MEIPFFYLHPFDFMSTFSGTQLWHKTIPWCIWGLKQHGFTLQGTKTCKRQHAEGNQKKFMLHCRHYWESLWLILHSKWALNATKLKHFHAQMMNVGFTNSNDTRYRATLYLHGVHDRETDVTFTLFSDDAELHSSEYTNSQNNTSPCQPMQCHYMMLQLVCGALWITRIIGPTSFFQNHKFTIICYILALCNYRTDLAIHQQHSTTDHIETILCTVYGIFGDNNKQFIQHAQGILETEKIWSEICDPVHIMVQVTTVFMVTAAKI